MVVGTAADYPPFEYYNNRYQLDGFDIGLIREIGKQLGVKVEIKDYAFDGLYNALQLGEIDVAIAAISDTPDRQQYVDFTSTYYAGDGRGAGERTIRYHFSHPGRAVGRATRRRAERFGV